MTQDRITHEVDPSKIKAGDLMAFVNYVRVNSVQTPDGLDLITTDRVSRKASEIRVRGQDLISSGYSADQYLEEQKLSRTAICRILMASENRPLTVCFIKKDGSTRVLRGKWIGHDDQGRSSCVDMDLDITDKDDRIREVDHRTLQYLIVEGVKYSVK